MNETKKSLKFPDDEYTLRLIASVDKDLLDSLEKMKSAIHHLEKIKGDDARLVRDTLVRYAKVIHRIKDSIQCAEI